MALRHLALAAAAAAALACSAASEKTPAPSTCGTHPPVVAASATPSSVEPVRGVVQLTATSTDEDDACLGSPELRTYAWRIDSRPPGSSAVVAEPAAPSTTFRPDAAGEYQLEVVAYDAAGHDSAPAFVRVSASACSEIAPTAWLPATMGATAFEAVTIPAPSVVDGNCLSTGANTYRWTLVSRPPGSAAVLSDPAAPSPTLVPDVVGPYQVSVVVTSSVGIASEPVFTIIDAARCGDGAPVLPALVASPSTPTAGQLVSLGLAGDVEDLNQTACGMAVFPYAYHWVLLSRPPGSTAALTSETSPGPSFVADVPGGAYQLALTVTDALGNASAPAFLTVTASSCGASAPTITQVRTLQLDPASGTATDAGTSRPAVGSGVALVATRFDADEVSGGACGETPEAPGTAYAWALASVPAGSSVSVPPGPQGGTFTFTPDVAGTFVFRVAAIDGHGLASTPVDVTVATGDCGPEIAALGSTPAAPIVGETVTASVTAGADACVAGGAPPRVAWSLVGRPAASGAVLTGDTSANASFVPDVPGGYTLQVVLTDDGGFSTVRTTNVVVGGCTSAPVIAGALSAAEIATAWEPDGSLASPAGTMYRGDRVVLALPTRAITPATCGGAASTRFTYAWALVSRPPGSAAELALPNGATPAFVPDVAGGTYQVMVAVTDGNGNTSAPAFFTLVASDCGARRPTADFQASSWTPNAYAPATLTAIAPADPSMRAPACPARFANGSAWTYAWRVVQAPLGSSAALSSDAGAAVTFQADTAGSYVVQLTTTGPDGTWGSAQKTIAVSACGTAAPVVVRAGGTPILNIAQDIPDVNDGGAVGTLSIRRSTDAASPYNNGNANVPLYQAYPVQVAANVVDPDAACGVTQTLSYAWSIVNQPAGSTARLNNANAISPSFTPDAAGEYDLQLVVTDSTGRSSTTIFQFTSNYAPALNVGACGGHAPTARIGVLSPYSAPTDLGRVDEPLGATVVFDGGASDSLDTLPRNAGGCGLSRPFTYSWTLVSRPSASSAALDGAAGVDPGLVLDADGVYVVQLTVTDGARSGSARLTVGTAASSVAQVAGNAAFSATTVDAAGNPVVAWIDLGPTSSPLRVARCVANCTTDAPSWTMLPDVDDLGATPFTWASGEEPRPLDVKVIGGVVTVLYSTTVGSSAGAGVCSTVLASFGGAYWTHANVAAGSGCDAAGALPGGVQFGRWVSLADKGGLPAFATTYVDGGGSRTTIAYNECSTVDCASSAVLTPATPFVSGVTGSRWPSLAFDAAGTGHLSYTLDATAAGGVTSLFYGQCVSACASGATATFASVAVADASGVNQGRGSRLALDTAGRPRIAYDRTGAGFGVQLATCDGNCGTSASWRRATVDSAVAGAASGLGFVIAPDGAYTVVVRNVTTNTLRLDVSRDAGASFTAFTPLRATGQPSIAATPAGGAQVAVPDGATIRSVLYGK